ncbi:UNVERIFIED_CONTAM: hypothetical protein K2H54_045717 [Gekko kuhli]
MMMLAIEIPLVLQAASVEETLTSLPPFTDLRVRRQSRVDVRPRHRSVPLADDLCGGASKARCASGRQPPIRGRHANEHVTVSPALFEPPSLFRLKRLASVPLGLGPKSDITVVVIGAHAYSAIPDSGRARDNCHQGECLNQNFGKCCLSKVSGYSHQWAHEPSKLAVEDVTTMVLCKPKLLPLKSVTLEKLEKMQRDAQETIRQQNQLTQ